MLSGDSNTNGASSLSPSFSNKVQIKPTKSSLISFLILSNSLTIISSFCFSYFELIFSNSFDFLLLYSAIITSAFFLNSLIF